MKKYYKINEWNEMIKYANKFQIIRKKTKKEIIKTTIAYILITFGIVTFPLPTGSIVCIGLGCAMINIKKEDILKKIENIKFKLIK